MAKKKMKKTSKKRKPKEEPKAEPEVIAKPVEPVDTLERPEVGELVPDIFERVEAEIDAEAADETAVEDPKLLEEVECCACRRMVARREAVRCLECNLWTCEVCAGPGTCPKCGRKFAK